MSDKCARYTFLDFMLLYNPKSQIINFIMQDDHMLQHYRECERTVLLMNILKKFCTFQKPLSVKPLLLSHISSHAAKVVLDNQVFRRN